MSNFETENTQLLVDPEPVVVVSPKRNTKSKIIEKIKHLCEQNNLKLHESDTTLKRMSKLQLNKLMAKKTEELLEQKIKNNVIQTRLEQSESVREQIGIRTLQYGLNVLNRMIEKAGAQMLPRYGYTMEGFSQQFEQSPNKEQLTEILRAILAENPDIFDHISSPYVRLAFVYVSCVTSSIRKTSETNKHAAIRPADDEKI